MTGTPTIIVTLDDGTGTYPNDITQFVRLPDGINWSRGRPDQYQDIGPGQLTLTIENIDGSFSFGGGFGFGLGPFGGPPFGGSGIVPGQGIRLTVSGQIRWTGRIVSSVVSWPGGGEEFAVTSITAIDDLARAGRRILRTSAGEEILKDAPAAYYPLGEESGAFFASDVTGNPQNPTLAKTFFVGGAGSVDFGGDLDLPDGSTGAVLTGDGISSVLYNINGGASWTSPNSLHFDLVMKGIGLSSGGTKVVTFDLSGSAVSLTVTASGAVTFGGVISTGTGVVGANVTHVVSINSTAGATDLWVDGVKVASGVGITGTWSNTTCTLGDAFNLPVASTLTVGHLNFGPTLSDARVLAHQSALLFDFRGETPAARITRAAGYAGIPVGTLDTTGATLMGTSLQAGTSVLDVFNDVAAATRGIVWIGADGAVTNITGDSIIQSTFPTAIHDANYVSTDTQVETDMAEVVNSATGRAAGSGNVTVGINQDSINQHGVYQQDYVWNVTSDDLARNLTNWQINTYTQPFPRVPTLKYDVLSMTLAPVLNALRLELGAFASVQSMPLQAPAGDLFVIIEGIAENITDSEWSITINGTRHALTVAWILGDSFFGKLNASTKLYV